MNLPVDSLVRLDASWHPIDRSQHRVMRDTDYDVLVTEPTAVYVDGNLSAVYIPEGVWLQDDLSKLTASLGKMSFGFDPQRRTASGGQPGGLSAAANIFGWMPRRAMRHDFCHVAAMAKSHPDLHEQLCSFGRYASDIYAKYAPDVWATHLDAVSNILAEKYLVSGVYTGGIVNKNSALGGHVDGGNVKKTWNSQLTIKKGIEGGYLVMPELRIALEVADGSMALFEAQSVWHGVTPVLKTRIDAVRYSVVWYCLAQLKNCLGPEEELQRIQLKKTEREWKRAGLV